MNYLYIFIPLAIIIITLVILLLLHLRKKSAINKVNSMSASERKQLLDTLAGPFGYSYDPHQDIFFSRLDAPQKNFGYTAIFDTSAPMLNMVFDYETIYFNYRRRTWLVEMWKGQYGINTGCELGVYYADGIIEPEKYNTTHFKAVSPEDMPFISLKLNRRCLRKNTEPPCGEFLYSKLGSRRSRHWWLTIFRMGIYAKPENLFVNTAIRFHDYAMLGSFLTAFSAQLPDTAYKVSGLTVYFTFDKSKRRYSLISRIVRSTALFFCRIYRKLFIFLTHPFSSGGDRLLYIYYYLPFLSKMPLRNRRLCKARKRGA